MYLSDRVELTFWIHNLQLFYFFFFILLFRQFPVVLRQKGHFDGHKLCWSVFAGECLLYVKQVIKWRFAAAVITLSPVDITNVRLVLQNHYTIKNNQSSRTLLPRTCSASVQQLQRHLCFVGHEMYLRSCSIVENCTIIK